MSSPPKKSDGPGDSAVSSPEYDAKQKGAAERKKKKGTTDFHALNKEMDGDRRKHLGKRTITDQLIDVFTPCLIFVMVLDVIWFLLDVRFVFTEDVSGSLRWVSFFLIMGVVAANRLVAQDGSDESKLYMVGLMTVSFAYSLVFTLMGGSVARNFMDGFIVGAVFNAVVLGFVWWMTNRLVHECCVDENRTAGDVGILTGTVRRVQNAISTEPQEQSPGIPRGKMPRPSKRPKGHLLEIETVDAVDPMEWVDPSVHEKKEAVSVAPSKKLSERHPGISIFYFSAAVMLLFALGLPVLLQGGRSMVFVGHIYVGVFTFAALMLLLLTSLGGLRQYFRSRHVYFPRAIGVFWIGLGTTMVAIVMFAAMRFPMPSMPAMVDVGEHEVGGSGRPSDFVLVGDGFMPSGTEMQVTSAVSAVGDLVMVVFGLFILFAALRAFGLYAASVARDRENYPIFVREFFTKVDAFLLKYVRIPVSRKAWRPRRVRRGVARSVDFSSTMRGEGSASRGEIESYVAHAYDAMCALAYDMGAPKKDDQTPYEFIESFPRELKGLRKEARVLTDLYVKAAYSKSDLDPKSLDQMRQFWVRYDQIRKKLVY